MSHDHVSWEQILDALESPETTHPFVHAHLAGCPRCTEMAGKAREIMQLLADARLPCPPGELVDRTLARLLAEDPMVGAGLEEALRGLADRLHEVWATLVPESPQTASAFRGSALGSASMLRYETDAFAITLSVSPEAEGGPYEVMGQVSPKSAPELPPSGRASIISGQRVLESSISEYGEFALPGLTTPDAELRILLGTTLIRLQLPSPAAS